MDDAQKMSSPTGLLPEDYCAMVLLVDDDAMVGELIGATIDGNTDINFHFCVNPGEALALAEEIQPTVILQDLVLPGVDGLTLVRAYRAGRKTRDIPIVVLSAREEPEVKREAFEAGANDYLVKLPDKIELLARIRYHTRAYLNQVQRDQAYRALRQSQQQLMEANIELQRLNKVDGLTGLFNRKYFDEFLQMEWNRAARDQMPLSLIMIDVDDFKRYNDTYGHLAGDEILKKVAEAVHVCFGRPADFTARFGGEEFAVVLPSTPAPGARVLGETVRGHLEALMISHPESTVGRFLTLSVGVATTVPKHKDRFRALIDAADKAMYQAKHTGKNRVVAYEGTDLPPPTHVS